MATPNYAVHASQSFIPKPCIRTPQKLNVTPLSQRIPAITPNSSSSSLSISSPNDKRTPVTKIDEYAHEKQPITHRNTNHHADTLGVIVSLFTSFTKRGKLTTPALRDGCFYLSQPPAKKVETVNVKVDVTKQSRKAEPKHNSNHSQLSQSMCPQDVCHHQSGRKTRFTVGDGTPHHPHLAVEGHAGYPIVRAQPSRTLLAVHGLRTVW
ncbi:hypothetical protein BLNAU_5429 [Blattamonas nauphoetae]|uniref:Uncharacterized protein n=1 Tax=Blattamonas nauphoetae TaxID=2049346 RepID=A0ABQ9Y7A7_9EUKA|nr:hypothetical protein BLNAU_5429 [Blattamonas nauphoetae]